VSYCRAWWAELLDVASAAAALDGGGGDVTTTSTPDSVSGGAETGRAMLPARWADCWPDCWRLRLTSHHEKPGCWPGADDNLGNCQHGKQTHYFQRHVCCPLSYCSRFLPIFFLFFFLCMPLLFISPPGRNSFQSGLIFCWHLFSFFSSWDLRVEAKFCRMLGGVYNIIIPVQNFKKASPKILFAKTMQNLARFRSTSTFDGEYLRNGWRYSKSAKCVIDRDSSRVGWKKTGKFWSTNCGDLDVKSYPPKSTFGRPYFGP